MLIAEAFKDQEIFVTGATGRWIIAVDGRSK